MVYAMYDVGEVDVDDVDYVCDVDSSNFDDAIL
jgi:hypothetical protein